MIAYLLFFTALTMEGIGSWISVIGLSAFFGGNILVIGIGIMFDIAKVTVVSFLYKAWDDINLAMRTYMVIVVCVLVGFTSFGAYGYLSMVFQDAIKPSIEANTQSTIKQNELTRLLQEKKELEQEKEKINNQISQLNPNDVKGRQRLIASFNPEQKRINNRINDIIKKTDELSIEKAKPIDNHAGPIIALAKALNVSVDDASKYIILLIVLVFDPFAISIVIAGNMAMNFKKPKIENEIVSNAINEEEYVTLIFPPKIKRKRKSKNEDITVIESNDKIIPNGTELQFITPDVISESNEPSQTVKFYRD